MVVVVVDGVSVLDVVVRQDLSGLTLEHRPE